MLQEYATVSDLQSRIGYDQDMDQTRSQREINDGEWSNPSNWSGKWPANAYFSKRDSRIVVPALWNSMFSPATINYGHRFGPLTMSATLLFIFSVLFYAHFFRQPAAR
jgi:hypothetical protein